MCNESTRGVVLSTLQSPVLYQSTVHDCCKIAHDHGLNLYNILLNTKFTKIETTHHIIPEKEELQICLRFWSVGEQRKRFKALMEDRIIRNDTE